MKCGSHISVDHPTLGLIDVRIGALRNFSVRTKGAPQVRRNGAADERRFAQAKRLPAEIGGSRETLPE